MLVAVAPLRVGQRVRLAMVPCLHGERPQRPTFPAEGRILRLRAFWPVGLVDVEEFERAAYERDLVEWATAAGLLVRWRFEDAERAA